MQQALFDIVPKLPGGRPLAGIARLAAASTKLESKRQIEYLEIPTRKILNRCLAERMPFEYTINPYRGCEFGCKYCYARYTHEYMELDGGLFETRIYAKQHAAELLRAELKKIGNAPVAIGTATDPYQPAERRFLLTRRILEVIAQNARGGEFGLVTKSDLVARDIDLFQEIARRNVLHVNVTVTTVRADLARALEPRASRPDLRLKALAKLSAAGIWTGVFAAPVIPAITDNPKDLEAVARAAAGAGARYFLANPLFLKPAAQKQFFPFLEKRFAHLLEAYRRRYEQGAFLRGDYPKRIQELVRRLRTKYNLDGSDYVPEEMDAPSQGRLFG